MSEYIKYETIMHLSYIYFYVDVLNRKLASHCSGPEQTRFEASPIGSVSGIRTTYILPLLKNLREISIERKIPSNEYYEYTEPALKEFSTIYHCLIKSHPLTTIERTTQREAIQHSAKTLKKITKSASEATFNYVNMAENRLCYLLWHITEVLKTGPEDLLLTKSLRDHLTNLSAVLDTLRVSPTDPFEEMLSIDNNPIATLNLLCDLIKPLNVWLNYYNKEVSFEENINKRLAYKKEIKEQIEHAFDEFITRKVILPFE